MADKKTKLTRQQMQDEALSLNLLLGAASSVLSSTAEPSTEEVHQLLDMAQGRAALLSTALDSVNAPEGME